MTCANLYSELIRVTKQKSFGRQTPAGPPLLASNAYSLKPVRPRAKRVALVFVYSNYERKDDRLPGAAHDMGRVAKALGNAGFDVETAIDPARNDLEAALERTLKRSRSADAAAIYATGHGLQHRGQVYLAPHDYPFDANTDRLPDLAILVPNFIRYMDATFAKHCVLRGMPEYRMTFVSGLLRSAAKH